MYAHPNKNSVFNQSGELLLLFLFFCSFFFLKKIVQLLIAGVIFILQGEVLASREATDCFFAMTKLFQSKDVVLRRMVYLGIKELSSIADDVIIVTSSLTKDMTGMC